MMVVPGRSRTVESYGEQMRRLRLELGMTQGEVADLVDASQETISVWERGRRYGLTPEAAALPRRVIALLRARVNRRRAKRNGQDQV